MASSVAPQVADLSEVVAVVIQVADLSVALAVALSVVACIGF